MIAPLMLVLMSAVVLLAALAVPGASDLVLPAGPALLASLFLLFQAWRRRADQRRDHVDRPRRTVPRDRTADGFRPTHRGKPKWILVDGSNVLYWKDNTPRIETLRAVVDDLTARGYTPGVVFDANAGYLVAGKYQHHGAMGALLGLPEDRVMVVAKGEPADTVLLAAARDLGAPIVTNDRYRDWADSHPEVRAPGHLIRGGFRDTALWLDLGENSGG